MKTRNVSVDHDYAIERGWVGPEAASSSGIAVIDNSGTSTPGITSIEGSGLTVTVDGHSVVLSTQWKIPCRVATTTAGTLASSFENGDVIDGVTLVAGDRILIKDQSDATENGIYVVAASGEPDRSLDESNGAGFLGAVVYVYAGSSNASSIFVCTNTTEPTLGTDDITWANTADSSSLGGIGQGAYTVETQNPMARRFLVQDGTFRDLLVLGNGILTVGTGATITDDTKYNSWPHACRMRNGQILVIYHSGNSHDTDNTGKVVGKIGTEALDGTISWGAQFDIYDHASLNVTPAGASSSSTGRVFATIMRFNVSVANTGEAGVVYSDDFGVTWTDWIDLTNGFTQEAYAAGPAVELPDGSLIASIEGTNTGTAAANRSSHTVLSADGGETWGSEVTVRSYATDSRPYYESCLLLVNNAGLDELLIFHRTSGGAGTIYLQRSTDLGASSGGWGTPAAVFSGYARPAATHRWTNSIVVVTRRNSDAAVLAFTSTDLGETWDTGTVVASGMSEMEYGVFLDLLTGGGLVIYGTQPSSSLTNADIKSAAITEGLVDIRSLIDVTGPSVTSHAEVVMDPAYSSPPDPVLTPDGTDWVYAIVT